MIRRAMLLLSWTSVGVACATAPAPHAARPISEPTPQAATGPARLPRALKQRPAAEEPIDNDTCSALLRIYRCLADNLPAATRSSLQKGLQRAMDAFAKLPEAKRRKACKQGVEALRKASAMNSAGRKLLAPCM